MKQHITVEQMDELSGKATVEIMEWGLSKKYLNDKELFLPSIGQMIEFLDKLELEVVISKPHLIQYEVSVYDKYSSKVEIPIDKGFHQGELVDCLWEAVKEVLEDNGKPTK